MPLQLSANQARYLFTSNNRNYSVYAFRGYEEVHKPYEFEIELVSRSPNEDIAKYDYEPWVLVVDETGTVTQIFKLDKNAKVIEALTP